MDNQSSLEQSNKYTFKLTLKDKITDPKKETKDLTLVQLKATDFKYNEAIYRVSLNSIQFNRKVYQPGEIIVEILFTLVDGTSKDATIITPDDLKSILLQRRVSLSYIDEDQEEEFEIATNYFVHEIAPKLKKDSSKTQLFIKMAIYSMDKLMTLNTYSKAYVCKKLATQILTEESCMFGYEGTKIELFTGNLQHLRLERIDGHHSEFIQPYLVQYNESFYDFVARTANRCGEFLFFDDGQLVMGLPEEDEAYPVMDYDSITYSDISSAPLTIKPYARDSVKGTKELPLNTSPVAKADTGYPEDVFGTELAYNSELMHDDYIFPMVRDKFTNYADQLGASSVQNFSAKLALNIFSEVVSNQKETTGGLANIGSEIAKNYLIAGWDVLKNVNDINSNGNKGWLDSNKQKTEQCDGYSFYQFAGVDEQGWVKLTYYSDIYKHEKAQQEKAICIDMGTHVIPVALGDKITVDKVPGKFIVTQINQVVSKAKDDLSSQKNVDDQLQQDSHSLQNQQIYAIPLTDDNKAYPPLLPGSVIRKSGPQTAFIVDNNDPKNQGRVRIAFPWQTVSDKNRQEQTKEAKETFRNKKDNEEKLLTEKKNHEKVLFLSRSKFHHLNKLLGDLSTKSEAEQKEHLKSVIEKNKKAIEENDKRIQELDKELNEQVGGSLAARLAKTNDELSKLNTLEKISPDAPLLYLDKANMEKKLKKLGVEQQDLLNQNEFNHAFREEIVKADKANTSPHDALNTVINDVREKELAPAEAKSQHLGEELDAAKKERSQAEETYNKLNISWKEQLKEAASPWVRVAMPMATYEGGMYFQPVIGDEVLVNFDNDNIERPYVTGSLYSKENLYPGGVMVIKSPSGQKLTFDVANDDETFFSSITPFIAQLGKFIPAVKPTFGKDGRKLCGGITFSDAYGMFSVSMSSNNRNISVNSPFGNVNVNAFTGISISAPNGDISISGKNVTIEAGNNLTLLSGKNVTLPGSGLASGTKKVHEPGFWSKVGSAAKGIPMAAVGAGIEFGIDKVKDAVKGFVPVDMGLIRCLADVFLRPIEGTLCIKSKNYVMLEAGKGKAKVTNERYSQNWRKFKGFEEDADKQIFYAKTQTYITRINQKVNQFFDDYVDLKRDALKKKKEYNKKLSKFWDKNKEKPKFMEAAFKLGDSEFKKNDENFEGGTVDLSIITKDILKHQGTRAFFTDEGILHSLETVKKFINPSAEAYAEAVWRLQKKVHALKTCFTEDTIKAVNQSTLGKKSDEATQWIDDAFKEVAFGSDNCTVNSAIKAWEQRFGSKGSAPDPKFLDENAEYDKEDVFTDSKYFKRSLVVKFLLKLYNDKHNELEGTAPGTTLKGKYFKFGFEKEADITKPIIMDKWNEVSALGPRPTKGSKVKNFALTYLDKITGVSGYWSPVVNTNAPYLGWDRRVWSDKSGKIIFSDDENSTYGFNGENIEKWSQAALSNEESLKQLLNSI